MLKFALLTPLLFVAQVVWASQTHEVETESHHLDLSPLFFVIMAVVIGAGTRYFLSAIKLPYTVALLLIGIGLGVLSRTGVLAEAAIGNFELDLALFEGSISWAANIDPHLVLYVFLPILIFEAAYAMDTHTFRKSFVNSALLAVPGILLAVFLTAMLVMAMMDGNMGFAGWNWEFALLFGAVISATDPVAVVSILKDLGASKKLGTLIEGESLLNDGTAIVIFMVILGGITGMGTDTSPIVEFFRVSLGGTLIGLLVGLFALGWIKKVFNDMLVEISIIVAAAYLVFFLSENVFHVSGVLGLVSMGLLMAGRGKRRISPEVQHFLHEFWEFAAFTANTLIFLIVGVVIALRTVFTAEDFLVLGLIYVGIHAVRAVVVSSLFPVMKRSGYGLNKPYAIVLWWGALRGAIGLALALIVAAEPSIDQGVRNDFLFLTAGIVTLTLLVNAVSMKAVVSALGITRVSPDKALAIRANQEYLRSSLENHLNRLKTERFLKKANWLAVREYMPEPLHVQIATEQTISLSAERRKILEKEKSSYWHQFEDGLLGDLAYKQLTEEINEIMDSGGNVSLSDRKDLENLLKNKSRFRRLQKIPFLKKAAGQLYFATLTNSYDVAQGFVKAQEDCMKLLESMQRATDQADRAALDNLEQIQKEIAENIVEGLTFLRNMGRDYPEIYSAISTRQATRILLNYERKTVERLYKKGSMTKDEAAGMLHDVEVRMKKLMDNPPTVELPDADQLVREVSWLNSIADNELKQVVSLFETRLFSSGECIINEQSDHELGLYVIVRGKARVSIKGEDVDVLGTGEVLGELSALSEGGRTATVHAESAVTALFIPASRFLILMQESPTLEKRIWETAARRLAVNVLHKDSDFTELSLGAIRQLVSSGSMVECTQDSTYNCASQIVVMLDGRGVVEGRIPVHPLDAVHSGKLTVMRGSRIFLIDRQEALG